MRVVTVMILLSFGSVFPQAWAAPAAPAAPAPLVAATDSEKASPGGFGMAVGPTNIRLAGAPGSAQTGSITVWNNGAKALDVVTELSDVTNVLTEDKHLEREFPPPGVVPYSCAKWVVLEQQELTVEAHSKKSIGITVSTPADASGGYACVVFFRGLPVFENPAEDDGKPKTSVVVQPRIGTLVFFEAEGTALRKGELLNLSYKPPQEDRPLLLQYEFKNTGNTDILLTGHFHIMDASKALIAKGDLTPIRTFPGDQGIAQTEWAGVLAPGDYQLVITMELGPDAQEVIVREIPLKIE